MMASAIEKASGRMTERVSARSGTVARVRFGALALAVAGILFVLYPAIRPFSDETSLQGAAAFASTAWILAHTLAILGFILLVWGVFTLYTMLQRTRVARLLLWGLGLSWLGVGLTLPFYGAEVFGLHAIGQEALNQQNAALLDVANQVRFGPGFTIIIIGLLALAVGTILVAIAIWKANDLPKWSGVPLALGFALYIPQYVASQPIRIAHGLLIAVGCLWLAADLWQNSNAEEKAREND
jgi:hypothetical protein